MKNNTPFELRRLSLGGQIRPITASNIELSVISQTILKKSSKNEELEESLIQNYDNLSKEELFQNIQVECNIYNDRERDISTLKRLQGVRSLQMNLLQLEVEYQKKRLDLDLKDKEKQKNIYDNLVKLQNKKREEYLESEKKLNQEEEKKRIHFNQIILIFQHYNKYRLERFNKL